MAARASRIAFAIMLAALCAACATVSDPASFAVVVHDKYDTMPCFEINNHRKSLAGRVKDLSELAAKAEASPGGFIVSYTAYRSELAQVRGQLAAAERGAQKNECGPPK